MKPKFYLRVIGVLSIIFPRFVNKCLVFDGWKIPYITDSDIRNDLSFKEINL